MQSNISMHYDSLLTAAHAWTLIPSNWPGEELRRHCWNWLSAEEKVRNESFRTHELRRLDLATRALCRAALSHYTRVNPADWIFRRGKFGKPKISEPVEFCELRFNLTHTKSLVICLLSRAGEVGVDAEEITRDVDIESIAANFLSREEYMRIAALPPVERAKRFFSQWVLKEAYLKGRGLGLAAAPERFAVKTDEAGLPLPLRNWQLAWKYPSPNHVAATAVRQPRGAPEVAVEWLDSERLKMNW